MKFRRLAALALCLLTAFSTTDAIVPSLVVYCNLSTGATQSIKQSTSIQQWVGASASVTLSLTGVTAGNDIVVTLGYSAFGINPGSVTCNDGTSYTVEMSQTSPSGGSFVVEVLRLRQVTAGTHSIVCTGNATAGNSFGQAMAHEVVNDANSTADQVVSATASSTSPATGTSGTLAQANEIVFAVACGDGTVTWSGVTSPPTTGYTSLYLDTADTVMPCTFAYKTVSATTAVSASWGTITSSNWMAGLATFKAAAGGVCAASTGGGGGLNAIKWHPGHWMLSDEVDRSSTGQIANKRTEQSICASSPPVKGWVGTYTWSVLEPTTLGVYDFSHIDADLAALSGTCTRLIIAVTPTLYGSSSVSEVIPTYILNSSAYGSSPVGGQFGYWTEGGGGTITTAIWRTAVMDRWAALFTALGNRYDTNPNVEAISTGNESVDGNNLDSGNDFSKAAMISAWTTLLTTAVTAMPHTSFILQQNFFYDNQSTADLMAQTHNNRGAFGGPDIFGLTDANFCSDLWSPCAYDNTLGTTPSFDYRGHTACMHEVQSPELVGGMGLGQYLPQDIFNALDTKLHCSHDMWNYWSQSMNTGDWTTSVWPMIKSNPVTHTGCPSDYTGGCNTSSLIAPCDKIDDKLLLTEYV